MSLIVEQKGYAVHLVIYEELIYLFINNESFFNGRISLLDYGGTLVL